MAEMGGCWSPGGLCGGPFSSEPAAKRARPSQAPPAPPSRPTSAAALFANRIVADKLSKALSLGRLDATSLPTGPGSLHRRLSMALVSRSFGAVLGPPSLRSLRLHRSHPGDLLPVVFEWRERLPSLKSLTLCSLTGVELHGMLRCDEAYGSLRKLVVTRDSPDPSAIDFPLEHELVGQAAYPSLRTLDYEPMTKPSMAYASLSELYLQIWLLSSLPRPNELRHLAYRSEITESNECAKLITPVLRRFGQLKRVFGEPTELCCLENFSPSAGSLQRLATVLYDGSGDGCTAPFAALRSLALGVIQIMRVPLKKELFGPQLSSLRLEAAEAEEADWETGWFPDGLPEAFPCLRRLWLELGQAKLGLPLGELTPVLAALPQLEALRLSVKAVQDDLLEFADGEDVLTWHSASLARLEVRSVGSRLLKITLVPSGAARKALREIRLRGPVQILHDGQVVCQTNTEPGQVAKDEDKIINLRL